MNRIVKKAAMYDLSRIREIYAYAREFMEKTGNPSQWGKSHPPVDQLQKDIAEGKLYVVEDGQEIHGVFYFGIEDDPTYHIIYNGAWHGQGTYGVIHRIAGDGSGGILQTAVDFASTQTDYLRIDTHHDNHVMQKALNNLEFQKCGIIYIADGSPRIAYDRIKKAST